jgi:hypothetical protein
MSDLEKHHASLTPSGRTSDPHPAHPPFSDHSPEGMIARLAYEFSVEINDILNAAALRLALIRWQPNGARSESDIVRLSKMIDRAGSLVRWLQDRSFAALEDRRRRGLERASHSRERKRLGH